VIRWSDVNFQECSYSGATQIANMAALRTLAKAKPQITPQLSQIRRRFLVVGICFNIKFLPETKINA